MKLRKFLMEHVRDERKDKKRSQRSNPSELAG
jgi:hypothetical protein